MLLQQSAIRRVCFRRPLRPDVRPCQPQLQRTVCGIRGQRLLQTWNALREFAGIDQGSAELLIGAAGSLGDLALVERSLGGFFFLVGGAPQAEFPLDVPGSPLHRGGLLRLRRRPSEHVEAFLVVESV